MVSTAKVIAMTAETVQANDKLLDDAQALMKSTRQLVEELRGAALNNAALAPKYAEGMQGVAGLLGTAANSFAALGDGLMFSVPTKVELDGIRPTVVMTRPLESQGTAMKRTASDLNASAVGLQALSTSIARDGQNMAKAIVDTSNKAIKLLDDSEMMVKRIRSQDLPSAVAELRGAAEQLDSLSSQFDMADNLPHRLLAVGLLLAVWCFFNSLGQLRLHSLHDRGYDQ
jgi:ABC-type transporter Mla subunit MlaD